MTQPNPHLPPPLPPLAHRAPGVSPSGLTGAVVLRFFAGLLLGAAVSAIVWIAGWTPFMMHGSGLALIFVPTIKFVVGIVCLFYRGQRSFGAGILVSIAIGILIFFGACAMHIGDAGMH